MNAASKFEENRAVVCIVGLGYVGLPLAEAFSRHIRVIGYDVDAAEVAELSDKDGSIEFTTDASQIKQADFVIIAVPTPVTKAKDPDLSYVMSAARTIGQNLKKGAIVVLESTVYPGATEEVVKPILEEESGLICGTDFKIGYSPERINPGDDAHSLAKVTKIVAGMGVESADRLAGLYGLVTSVYRAKDIKTAEAAKAIEGFAEKVSDDRDVTVDCVHEVAHDEFRGMVLPDVGQFMSMDEKPVLVDVRGCLIRRGLG
jgi:UDPglucose 6-dehydrogenase/UDP-N-acetyl-D-galactosamine dehydrogenase